MNTRAVKRLVDESEEVYHRCWTILVSLRNGRPDPLLREFQHMLARSMFALEDAYQAMARRRQRLIERKRRLSRGWFAREQARLSRHQNTVHRAMGVGYSLGDAFAWYFYQFDRPLLDQHAAHDLQTHPTSGIGGQAELAALAAFVATGRYIPIYHGITTILRIGDITLVDMERWRVAALGEVKTTKPDANGRAELTVTFVGHRDDFPLTDFKRRIRRANPSRQVVPECPHLGTTVEDPAVQQSASPPPASIARRFERQIKRTHESLDAARKRESVAAGSGMTVERTPQRSLTILARNSRPGRASFGRLDDGLVALAYRSKFRSLFARVTQTEQVDPSGFPPEALTLIRETLVSGSPWNGFIFGAIHYGSDGLPNLSPGMLPVTWWGMDVDTIEDILFHAVAVLAVWNPASVLKRLEAASYHVDGQELPNTLRLTRESSDGRCWSYVDSTFSALMPRVLVREKDLVETIKRFFEHAARDENQGTRVELQTIHEYFSQDAIAAFRQGLAAGKRSKKP